MSISDVLSRVSTIEQQLQQLNSGTLLDSVAPGGTTGTTGTSSAASTSSAGSTADFANALAQAEGGTAASAGTTADGVSSTSGSVSDGAAVTPTTATSPMLTSGQQQFASTLSAATGLSPSVVSSWLLAEESGSAAQSRQAQGNNDWLNIGYTGSGDYGASDSAWSDPSTAAAATAGWLKGQNTVPGYGTASTGIQAIMQTVGQDPQAQVAALQTSGWASSGYPDLGALYAQVAG